MLTAVITFLGGLALLLAAGQLVVSRASFLGGRLGLNPMVIGLTIVAAGTSAPELAVVGQSIAVDDTELAVGSIIGSNIANVLLVLGLAATFGTIHVMSRAVRVDIPVMIAASTLLLVFSLDGVIERVDGLVLVSMLTAFVVWTVRATRSEAGARRVPAKGPSRPERLVRGLRWRRSVPLSLVALAAGIGGLVVAARFVVGGAEEIAASLGIPELIIGLTIVAIGTSAPEIATTLIAALQGRRDLAVGNAVGSNIFNILLVLGSTGLIAPDGIAVSDDAVRLDLPVLLAAAVACLPIVAWDHKLDRWEGALFVGYYVAYVVFLVLDGTGHRASEPFALIMGLFVLPLTLVTAGVLIRRQRARARAVWQVDPSQDPRFDRSRTPVA